MPHRRSVAHVPPSTVLLIVGAVAFFSATEMVVKLLTQRVPVPLVLWGRYAVQAAILAVLFAPGLGLRMLRTAQPGLHLMRSAVLIASSLFFYYALRELPLADATAIIFSAPVMVIVLSVAVLRERLTRPRLAFVVAGFAGVLLVLRPGMSILQGAAFLALVSAALYAVFQILTRMLRGDDPRVTLLYPAVVGAVLITPALPLLGVAFAVTLVDAALLLLVGALGSTGHFMFIRAFRGAPASALAPFTYSQIVWAVLFGWLAFGQFPDAPALAGIVAIAGSGLLLAWHERRLHARSAAAAPVIAD